MSRPQSLVGRQNHSNGAQFERILSDACAYYSRTGVAEIAKTPEPVRQLGAMGREGRFPACYVKRAQPDYKGTLRGGRAIVFEAKHTERGMIARSAVTDAQSEQLDRHLALGALCAVAVSFGFRTFHFLPWEVFRNMKEEFGRKRIGPEDVARYRVHMDGGVLLFLGREGV